MGQAFDKAKQLDEQFVMHTYGRKQVEFVRGSGMHLYDDEGREYLDFLSGIGVVSVGHCNPRVNAAIKAQVDELLHVSNYYYVAHRGEVAEKLSAMLAGTGNTAWKSFFANSGAEANEGAIKLARRFGKVEKNGAGGIITAVRSFHGRTLATLSATGQDSKQDPFAPLPRGFAHVPLNDIAALEEAIHTDIDSTAPIAVMLECIQGEAGVWPCTPEYMKAARELTREAGMLLIIDEVQTGLCRTGENFAFQLFDVEPDIVTTAKGIADGLAMGAFSARGEIADLLEPGMHGSTFGGGPVVCAASEETLAIMTEPGFKENVRVTGAYLRDRLSALPFVKEVRGVGLMVGATLSSEVAAAVVNAGLDNGVVLNAPAADILRFLPPLICSEADVDEMIEKLTKSYEEATR